MLFFLLNLGLAAAWSALIGSFDAATLAAGYVVGYVVIWALQPALGYSAYVGGVGRFVRFVVLYLTGLVWSSVLVAIDVCRPRLNVRPGVVGYRTQARSDAELTVLSNLISLTPGTLVVDVSPDRRMLYVHAMDLSEGGPDALRDALCETLEQRVLALLRGPAALDATTARPTPHNGYSATE
jgi:multicomponent Na+:H+ antiporter subunit E